MYRSSACCAFRTSTHKWQRAALKKYSLTPYFSKDLLRDDDATFKEDQRVEIEPKSQRMSRFTDKTYNTPAHKSELLCHNVQVEQHIGQLSECTC